MIFRTNGGNIYQTKGELLESLGKDRKDVRCIDRMISRGEVEKVEGGYIVHDPVIELKEEVRGLEEENRKLKDQLEMYEKVYNDNAEDYNRLVDRFNKYVEEHPDNPSSNPVEIEELRINYEYLEKKFQRLKKGYNLVIDYTYKYIRNFTKVDKEEYREQLSSAINEELGNDEY